MKKKIKKILKTSLYSIYENYQKNKKQQRCIIDRDMLIETYQKSTTQKKIQIGCGSNILEGWLNTDLNYKENIAFLDAGMEFPLDSNTFDFVYSEHLFEHLKVEQQLNMLTESYRILKKGGVMRIAMPSIDFLIDLYENHEKKEKREYVEWAVKNVHNLKKVDSMVNDASKHYCYVINNFFKAWGHQVLHNFSSIESLSNQSGFKSISECKINESDHESLRNVEKHGTIIPNHINEIETFVVELTK
jgi:predicted SAM-dependent methyltransferase